ncbi:hypothetical protein PCANC_03491 [Puccinia coronata f. sp. avenae]|uniref:Uncharacterized protein n=1 Tax=Puccinia coronata f. sp. avenae TaxID=200324 RepID=A0A2N5SWF9_9BASI|nr:hypothetical protein PCANC_13745 [Puccinia coronata f. sp. avenae]PLW55596.1 hypothetical protein PCANC_03491 [Puccinia coronata f. sp. avenae]
MKRSEPEGSPLARKKPATRRKFAKEVYKPSNRLLPPNKRLWGSENTNDVSEDTGSSKEIQVATKQASLKKVKLEVDETSEPKVKAKPGRKIASKPVKLSDKSNAQTQVVRPSGRVTRSSAMTNSRVGRSKMEVLDEQEEVPDVVMKVERERVVEPEDADCNFLDVSADHRMYPVFRTTKPTQQSLGPDVTLTFDIDRHARALADCSPIRPAGQAGQEQTEGASAGASHSRPRHSPTPVIKNKRTKLTVPQAPIDLPSPPIKKRTRRQPAPKPSKSKLPKSPASDDPLMI